MNEKQQKSTSKYLSLLLRHKPETVGLTLDENAWADTTELLEKLHQHGFTLSFEELKSVVMNNDKKRFTFSEDFSRIRANQGHSIDVDLGLAEKTPPDVLFHGTAISNLKSIREKGLHKGKRHHVHLSADEATALTVGQRYGKPVVLLIKSGRMHHHGMKFYQSQNHVWLTDHVPADFIQVPF